MKIRKREKEKILKGDYECQDDRATKINKKKYLYQELEVLTLNYTSWIGLNRFQNSQPTPNL